ncbi:MDIS1-interacting receptor like kinase 1 [Brachypodium distachyon]|uniref:Protein kinase domain-containing protein n=1 Tax=Brachypodium distachyon TaxID=15368 RepID=A0A2K2CXJ9_BRADI|nr:MDIS1-interacting receptor like kinase 1 [Brachypodium distachyon]XP_024316441.1 MDIS1-interacting receptor like kinase 1 [Brachypodium distachyon]PNT66757.1 hypothetical protein BRADI_3g16733v3 [Brachypodium distachyon]PNT66758.1 hypothetical protein BRADI_3g16733v3 [Brachypodium distachyon]|eukprot:XP_024316440.1 MDIS1-interacting receptor like kinase 1 [Brachypodium distachyon]
MSPGWKDCAGCFKGSETSNDCHPLFDHILNNLRKDNVMSCIDGCTWRSEVHRVQLQNQSKALVVKKVQNESGNAVDPCLHDHCQSEVNLLDSICHDNIISLADYIRRDNFILLIYDHEENGSLYHWLHNPVPPQPAAEGVVLEWPTRRGIAIRVADGLCHLHYGRKNPVVHHNINSTNILLDADLNPKIAGFDLARVVSFAGQPVPISELAASNMFGYTAPEYLTTGATVKVDSYSYGVVLLELATGRVASRPLVTNEAIADGHLGIWAGIHSKDLVRNAGDFSTVVDMAIPDQARYLKEMVAMFKLGVDCTVEQPQERPDMNEVLHRLRNLGR